MADDSVNIFGSRVTWRRAFSKAALIEGALLFLLLPGLAISGGADNPFGFYWAFALQFPASLLFPPLSRVATQLSLSDLVPGVIVCLLEMVVITVLLRKPWHRG
jgi:hypothetical protein